MANGSGKQREAIRQAGEEKGGLTLVHIQVLLDLIEDTFSKEISDVKTMIPKYVEKKNFR